MEDIYTIKVKTRPDPGGLYPSERRYSASNVSGLAWIHLALAVMSFLLACLALVNPIGGGDILELQTAHDDRKIIINDYFDIIQNGSKLFNITNLKLPMAKSNEYGSILITAPSLLTVAALISGIASILASKQWYIDRNIKWLFVVSVFSTILSLISFCMITVWIGIMSEGSFQFTNFYKNLPYDDNITPTLDSTNIVIKNSSLYYIVKVPLGRINSDNYKNDETIGTLKHSHNVTKRVLSINILIAAFLELVWSCLSVRISWKGMCKSYPEDEDLGRRSSNCLEVVTTLKGNNMRNLPRNTKILQPKPDIFCHYPKNSRIKRLILAQQDLRSNLSSDTGNPKLNSLSQSPKENSVEYRQRMYNFLNKCPSSFEDIESNPGGNVSSLISETSNSNVRTVSPIYEEPVIFEGKVDSSPQDRTNSIGSLSCMSWGDSNDQTIYNQNTIDLDTIIAEKRNGISVKKIENEVDINSEVLPNLDLPQSKTEKSKDEDPTITHTNSDLRINEERDVTIENTDVMMESTLNVDSTDDLTIKSETENLHS